MANLKTDYMGLKLKNPLVVGSSGITKSVENIIEIEKQGAGAVVLKSLFEEQIKFEARKTMNESSDSGYDYPEAYDYIANYSRENAVSEYLRLISDAKKAVNIPIIASINCVSAKEWTSFAKQIESAGADALELNVFILPSDINQEGKTNEAVYFDIIEKVKKELSIPISLKISYYFSGLAETAKKLSWTGIGSLVLFNRFFSPDIDIDNFKITSTNVFSTPEELSIPLRWIAILSDDVRCDLAASTGIHNHEAMIKQLLAGAKVVQISSVLYEKGISQIPKFIEGLEQWMEKHSFKSVDDFRGKMSYTNASNPAGFERVQFMKHFSGIE